ncbi:MAG: diacylglycerol kinase family lipid kinase [Gemmatimonadetes bacterium]|nr:diacylglycerol kinase family lipid kinase [Gemmatimonadota bacterium]
MNSVSVTAAGSFAGRTLIILNPHAGNDDEARMRRRLGGAFAARGAAFDLVATEHAGHATELAAEAARLGYRAVAVCGGDGTLAEAATGLAGTVTPLAIIPRGTANQVAQNLGIPRGLENAVEVAVSGVVSAIDLGRINDRAFALLAGAGYDAAVMQSATRELKERWGFGAYVYAAVKEALTAGPRRFRITADGRDIEVEAVSVMVANVGELFAHWLPIRFSLAPRPTSAWRDGLLDVVIVAPRNAPDLAAILWRSASRRVAGSERLLHFQTHEITIDADPPIAVQVDGDPAGMTPVSITVMREALRVFIPA